ncbi:TPA: hypothetical protein ACU8BF_001733 [Neisseria subflava]|nr:hypothetical protein [Neisseria lactamica]MBS6064243.1 hypothetical protein [Neisseria mucosa]
MEGQKTVGLNGNGTGFDGFTRYAGTESFVKIMFTAGFFGYLKGCLSDMARPSERKVSDGLNAKKTARSSLFDKAAISV